MKIPMKHLIATVLMTTALVSTSIAQKLTPAGSAINFTSKQMGVNVEGNFKKFDAQVAFDPKKPEAGKIAFNIDLTSVDIGDAGTMSELKKPGWFDSARTPSASFTSTAIKAAGPGKFDITGNLVIKGISKPVTVPITLTQQGLPAGQTRADGSFVIKRLEYKIGDGDWNDVSLVANDIQVKVSLIFTGIAKL
jgi:polyisoprenoid-binding protein YceI